MNKKIDFLGVCISAHSVRGYEVTDRKQVWVGDHCYNYSLDSDSEAIAKDAVEKHLVNCPDHCPVECAKCVRGQLGLEELKEEIPAVETAAKTAKKATKKPAVKAASRSLRKPAKK